MAVEEQLYPLLVSWFDSIYEAFKFSTVSCMGVLHGCGTS